MSSSNRTIVLFVIVLLALTQGANASPGRRERGTITCKTELIFVATGKGAKCYSVKGPSLISAQYAAWDEKIHEYYGDVVFFHANGLVMPDIQPEFFLSISYRVDNRDKVGFKEPLEVLIKLYDNRTGGSGGLEHLVTFNAGDEHILVLEIENQDKLWFEKRYANDRLTMVRATCRRKAY